MEELKIEELRIGNFVLDEDGDELEIIAINKQRVFHPKSIFSEIETIRGIPLTKKRLVKFGFNANGVIFLGIDVSCHKLQITKSGDVLIYDVDDDFICLKNIKYAHQAQNLFFTLTGGKELTFKTRN